MQMKDPDDANEALELVNKHSLSHPYIKNACCNLGISHEELVHKPLKEFFSITNTKTLAEVYFRHHEARRKAKLVLIGKYLLEKTSTKSFHIARSLSSSSAKAVKSLMSPKESSFKIDLIKRNLVKKLKVAKNIRSLKEEEEKKKKLYEEKILEKSSRGDKRTTPEQQMKFVKHDLRIKEILEKKQKDLQDHERRAISSMSVKREVFRTQTSTFNTQRKKQSRVPEIDIEQKLVDYDRKMAKSTERAKKALITKASSSYALVNHVSQVRAAKERIELTQEQKNIEKINKISRNLMESSRRREALIGKEQKRINLSLKTQKQRWSEECSKINKSREEKEKELEANSFRKEKTAIMIKESLDRTLQLNLSKISHKKKKDHEININRIQKQFEKIRSKMIARVRESDTKMKPELNIEKVRSKLESKLMSQLNL